MVRVYEAVYCGVCDYCGRPIVDRNRKAIEDFYVVGRDAVCKVCYNKSVAESVIDGVCYDWICEEGKTYAECLKLGEYKTCMEIKEELGEEPICDSEVRGRVVRKFEKGQTINEWWAFPKKVFVCDDPSKYGTMELIDAIVEYRRKH